MVHNRTKGALKKPARQGGQPASSPKELAQRSDVVMTMLPDFVDVEQVVLGAKRVLEGVRPGMLFVDMSTVAPSTALRVYHAMREKQVQALDAPGSGGEIGTKEATLSLMVGGEEEAFQRVLPIFQAMGKNIVLVGGPGAGKVTKACDQMIVALKIEADAEALTLASKSGMDPARVREALFGGICAEQDLGGMENA